MIETGNKTKLAVFDFDGTIIPDQSGLQIAKYLAKSKVYNRRTVAKLLFWGFRYKAHLPYREKTARELIFQAFENEKAEHVNQFIDDFYEKHFEDSVRLSLIDLAEQFKDDGCEIIILSGAFTSTLGSFARRHDFMHIVGTVMEVDDDGNYTGKVFGECVAGDEKIKQLKEYANKIFGENNWEIEYAFADHYTDRDLLDLANQAYAVDPDKTLRRHAKKQNWQILDL